MKQKIVQRCATDDGYREYREKLTIQYTKIQKNVEQIAKKREELGFLGVGFV